LAGEGIKILTLIPCLNEEKHIAEVVQKARRYSDIVCVADGGSEDGTCIQARIAGANIYLNYLAKGLGDNLRSGLNKAIQKHEPDIIILLDGDGQHNPDEIPNLLRPILNNQADVVVGNRISVKGMPPYRLFGNGILSAVMNFRARQQFKDAMTGFWAIKTDAIPGLTEHGWGIYVELLIKARANGHRLTSVPITPIYHKDYSENSTETPFRLGLILLWSIIKWRFKCEVLK
jgi:glycosyltransferase involved in cell wall biosynthesis